jgi:hypothetical protein
VLTDLPPLDTGAELVEPPNDFVPRARVAN